ncbi:MAG: T9SS type A sorting domain-containing protein [Saprospiraceae bacterium]|nr:T9SS type A sorting domain-containing protein [Saprospiraceae bacterium]
MRVLHNHHWCGILPNTFFSLLFTKRLQPLIIKALAISALLLPAVFAVATNPTDTACDNLTSGGTIAGNEFGCPSPTWDPSVITNVTLPSGGSGTIEYVWMFTTGDPNIPVSQWSPIPGSTGPSYDPGPITVTTYYRRCSRRSGCSEWIGETNIVVKEAICCDNVTSGGTIAANQSACLAPFDPALLTNVTLPTGGTLALEYQWVMSTSGTAYTPTNTDWTQIAGANAESYNPGPLLQTAYFLRLSRRHGCLDYAGVSNMITISITTNFEASVTPDAATCFGGSDGSIDLTATGGTIPYTYAWSGNAGTDQDPANLAAGSYTVTVTDANGCTTTASTLVLNGAQVLVAVNSTDESCNGADNGTAFVTNTNGGTSPYSYRWNTIPIQTLPFATNLSPGSYTVTATDLNGCTATAAATVNAGPAIGVTLAATDVICFGQNTGAASVFSTTNGGGNLTYLWSPGGATTSTISNLLAGTYTVTVSNSQGCSGTASALVADGPQIFTNPTVTDATCNYTWDGSIALAVSGGVSPFNYQWNDPAAQTTAVASNLAAGTYSVTITDANGCTATTTQTVEAPMPADVAIAGTNISCFNGNNGTATITITNGSPASYNYFWSNGATTATATGFPAGTHGVTITDNNGCLVTESIVLTQPTQLQITLATDAATCGNGNDGSVTTTVSGGVPFGNGGYNYAWSGGGTPNGAVLQNGAPGNYTVTVTDANGCTILGAATIGAPPVLVANLTATNVTCNGLANGQLIVVASGGVGSYTYLWNNASASTGTSINNLAPGNYNIVITDDVGCTATAAATITEPAVLTVSASKFDVVCPSDTDGSAIALPTGGTAPYSYLWSNASTTANISNLGVGSYSVTVTDANGCTASTFVQIISTTTLALSTSKIDAKCFASNDGSATAIITGGSTPFNIVWNNGATTAVNSNLVAGNYAVTVTDADGCVVSASTTVTAPSLLTSPISLVAPITTYGGSNGSIKVTPAGGVTPYSVLWSNASAATTLANLSAGAYTVTTTDANGCTATAAFNLQNPAKLGDFVWHDLNQNGVQDGNEPGLDSVKVHLIGATFTGTQVHLVTYSNANGLYVFDGLGGGVYQIKCDLPSIHLFSPANVGNDNTDSDINPADSLTALFNLPNGTFQSNWDIGLIELDEKINIGDFVWYDTDRDGIQDLQEQGLANFTVRLYSMPGNTLVSTKVTNSFGKYLFTDVLPGQYQVEFALGNLSNGQLYAPQDQGTNDALDSDPNPNTGRTTTITVYPYTADNLTIDAGVYKECDNVTDGGLIGYNESLCGVGADPAEIVSLELPSGGFGTLQYLWLKSTTPVYNGPGDPNWSQIANSNSPNYNPGPISQTTYYIRCSRRAGCPDYPGETNIVSKTITPNPLAQIIDAPITICNNVGDRFEAAIAGGGATYAWDFGADASIPTAQTRVVNAVSWSSPGVKTVSLTVTRFGCSVTITTAVQVNLCGSPLIVIFDDVFAEMDGEYADIRWKVTGGEPTKDMFFVQRSENGLDFENIAAITGTAADADGYYHAKDENLRLGDNIYRIVCRRNEGNSEDAVSQTASIFYKPAGVHEVQVYPNPTNGAVTVEFVKQSPKLTMVEVRNAYGKLVMVKEIEPKTERTELDLSRQPLGIYMIRINSENVQDRMVKVVKAE